MAAVLTVKLDVYVVATTSDNGVMDLQVYTNEDQAELERDRIEDTPFAGEETTVTHREIEFHVGA